MEGATVSCDGILIDRDREVELLTATLARLGTVGGGVVLLSGEPGVGKTALVEAVLATTTVRVLRGAGYPGPTAPYEPLDALLRESGVWSRDAEVAKSRPVASGPLVEAVDAPDHVRTAVFAALRRATGEEPTVVFLDDLHWADSGTFGVLERWTPTLVDTPVLMIGAYRSDGLARRHPLRRLRTQLRRGRGLIEIRLAPLEEAGTALVIARRLGEAPSPELAALIHERSQGVPFYVEALTDTLASQPGWTPGAADLDAAAAVIPERIRDAVLFWLDALSPAAVELAEVVAAAGMPLPAELATEIADAATLEELCDSGFLAEVTGPSGRVEVVFRHALVPEALCAATPWSRRRDHHRRLGEVLEASGGSPQAVAAQWLAAGDTGRARPWLVAAAKAAYRLHAYQDAAAAIRTALESWRAGDEPDGHLGALDLWAVCAQRSGELDDAATALQAIAKTHRASGDDAAAGEAERRLAGVQELRGDLPGALAARGAAIEAFERAGRLGDAGAERLLLAEHLDGAGHLSEALLLVRTAAEQIPSDDVPLRARAFGLEGVVRAGLGELDRGVALARDGLDLALASGSDEASAEAHYLWAVSLEYACRYPETLDAYSAAFEYCRSRGLDGTAQLCLACLAPSLRRTGRWQQAIEVCRDVIATPGAPDPARAVAHGELGLILAARGETNPARGHLTTASAFAGTFGLFGVEIETAWGLARLHEADGNAPAAAEHLNRLVSRCAEREERHFAVAPLRWAASFFAQHGLRAELAACTDVLACIAGATGAPEALAALASALAETALLDGDARRAADGHQRAFELLAPLDLPPEEAEVGLRCGVTLAAAGAHDQSVERLVGCYHTARNLRARPLALAAARELAALGEDVTRRLGRRAATDLQN
ncbi:MAG: AAA family ATPase, partial [Actinomycetota bacterium]|nr:AAA family ATPase [Actinomycetota bacterium]